MIAKATDLVRLILTDMLQEGDFAVDATCGNGHDTLHMWELVKPTGAVVSIDIQEQALANARNRLGDREEGVSFVCADHARLAELIPQGKPADVVVFNLGYLPGGDKSLITGPDTTIPALEQALNIVAVGGGVLVTLYTGHPGGQEEAAAVEEWARDLPPKQYSVARHQWVNLPGSPPFVYLIERRA